MGGRRDEAGAASWDYWDPRVSADPAGGTWGVPLVVFSEDIHSTLKHRLRTGTDKGNPTV